MKREDPVIDTFIERAREQSVAAVFDRLGLAGAMRGSRGEWVGPCPVAGGRDGFSVNVAKDVWNCRKCSAGGRDGIGLAAHVAAHDVSRREGFLAACADALGEALPHGGESAEERRAREQRLADAREKAAREKVRREAEASQYRNKERNRARAIYAGAAIAGTGSPVWRYLERRLGHALNDSLMRRLSAHFRYAPECPFWEDGPSGLAAIHRGPAMVLPFYDRSGIVGCHITWIDLANAPKFRPDLGIDPKTGDLRPTKKMRGTKAGGLIPLFGTGGARRWVGGEGIENVTAVALGENFRSDTFYFAAGDLGNLAGPSDAKSNFAHPTLTRQGKDGRARPVRVPGPAPLEGSDDRAVPVAAHVASLVLCADGDSETVFTAAAMARARARFAREDRPVAIAWPKPGTGDFSEWLRGGDA